MSDICKELRFSQNIFQRKIFNIFQFFCQKYIRKSVTFVMKVKKRIKNLVKLRLIVLEIQRPQKIFHVHTNILTDKHSVKTCFSGSLITKTCKSVENWISRIFSNLILSSRRK